MKVVGFSFIRNAIKFDYPIEEAILSVLPICDEFVVAVGQSEDDTLSLIQNIDSDKVRIIETVWDDSLRTGGRVLAQETNKAFQAVAQDADWAFYIQGDEVLHEKYHDEIRKKMLLYKDDESVDGLLFKYLHFYGSYDYIATSSKWYRHEIRIIKNNKKIYSYRDAQGFRIGDNQKLGVKPIDAYIYHYGWVKPPKVMQKKREEFNKLWCSDEWIEKNIAKVEDFDYGNIDSLALFEESHPKVMKKRIEQKNWHFEHDISFERLTLKEKTKRLLEKLTGKQIGEYKNYKIV